MKDKNEPTKVSATSESRSSNDAPKKQNHKPIASEYVFSVPWLIGGIVTVLIVGVAFSGLYYYRASNLALDVVSFAKKMSEDADAVLNEAEAIQKTFPTLPEAERQKQQGVVDQKRFSALEQKRRAADHLNTFNRKNPGSVDVLTTLRSILESMLKVQVRNRALQNEIKSVCKNLIQVTPDQNASLQYVERLMELEWETGNVSETLNRAQEVLQRKQQTGGDDFDAWHYITLAKYVESRTSGSYQVPTGSKSFPPTMSELFKFVNRRKPENIEIASLYANFLMNLDQLEMARFTDESLRTKLPKERETMAMDAINDMVNLNVNNAKAYLIRFRFKSQYGLLGDDPENLEPDLVKSLSLDPKDDETLRVAGMFTLSQVARAKRSGNTELAKKLREKGEKFFRDALMINPTNDLVYQTLGDVYCDDGNLEEAIKIWTTSVTLARPHVNAEIVGRLASALIELKKYDEAAKAIALLEVYYKNNVPDADSLRARIQTLAELLAARVNMAQAVDAQKQADSDRVAGKKADAQQQYGIMSKKKRAAAKLLHENLVMFGKPSDYLIESSSIFMRQIGESLMLLAQLLGEQGKWDEAVIYYEKAARFPMFGERATVAIALAYQQDRRPEDAIRMLQLASEASPDNIPLRYLYTKSLFRQELSRNEYSITNLEQIGKQLQFLDEHKGELSDPWSIDIRQIHLEMVKESTSNNSERILKAQQHALSSFRALESKEMPVSEKPNAQPEAAADGKKIYSDNLEFLTEMAGIYSGFAAFTDFDRVLAKIQELPGGEEYYYSERINDSLRRNDRQGAIEIANDAMQSTTLTIEQKQRFVNLLDRLQGRTTQDLNAFYLSLQTTFDENPDSLNPQYFFLLGNMALDREDFDYAQKLQERLENYEGTEGGTLWRYLKARAELSKKNPQIEEVAKLQHEIAALRPDWELTHLLNAMIIEKKIQSRPDDIELKREAINAYKGAIACGHTVPMAWNRLFDLYQETQQPDNARQLVRDALIRGIRLDVIPGQFPPTYERMYVQVVKALDNSDFTDADTVAKQCVQLAKKNNEPSELIRAINVRLGKLFLDNNLLEGAERHLREVAVHGGSFVYPLAVCLTKKGEVDAGFTMIIDEMYQTPSSFSVLLPSLLVLLTQVQPSEDVYVQIDEIMTRIENGQRFVFNGNIPENSKGPVQKILFTGGIKRLYSMALYFPENKTIPPADSIKIVPVDEVEESQDSTVMTHRATTIMVKWTAQNPDELLGGSGPSKTEPKITPIAGGYYIEWPGLTPIAGVHLSGPLRGDFTIEFDVPMDAVGKPMDKPNSPAILQPLADYWILRGTLERAIPLYERGLEIAPNDMGLLNNLAMLLSRGRNDHAKALAMIDKALEDRASEVDLLDSKGLINLNANRVSEAIPPLEKAVQLSCNAPVYCLHLAYAYFLDGRDPLAKENFDKAVKINARDKLSDTNQKMFDTLSEKFGSNSTP